MCVASREIKLVASNGGNLLNIIILFVLMFGFAIFSVNLSTERDAYFLPVMYICSIFTLQISMHRLFEDDYNDGSLEQFLMYSKSLASIVMIKVLVHWVCFGLPIAFIGSVVYFIIAKSALVIDSIYLGFTTSISTITVIFTYAASHALVIGRNNSMAISQLVVVPVMVPTFIYSDFLFHRLCHYNYDISLLSFSLMIVAMITICIFTASYALKLAIEDL